jgi:VWFA-related protein
VNRHDGFLSRREWLTAAASLWAAPSLAAQQDATFSTSVKVVNVLATVRNGKGEIVRNLTSNDFAIDEDGRPQVIRYFSQETELPLTLGLLIDVSGSQRRVLPEERRASYTFLSQVLREDKDAAFLIQFDRDVELIKDLTSSRRDLETALDSLDAPELRRPGSGGGGRGGGYPGGTRGRGNFGGTSLYDAVYLASNEVLKKQSGRKAVILLSDGVDNASKISLTDAVESAQRADTLVYAILFADGRTQGGGFGPVFGPGTGRGGRRRPGRTPPPSGSDGKKVLERISRETGGAFFEVSKKEPLEGIYKRIEEELRNQYSLGYTSDRTGGGAGYRKIHVTARQKGLAVQTRDGYYPGA